jgi:hypothetical protein
MSSERKSCAYLAISLLTIILMIFFREIAREVVAFSVDPVFREAEELRFQNMVDYTMTGLLTYFILCSLEFTLLSRSENLLSQKTIECVFSILEMFILFIFSDIVFQNRIYEAVEFHSYSMSPSTQGGLIGLSICLLRDFFKSKNDIDQKS